MLHKEYTLTHQGAEMDLSEKKKADYWIIAFSVILLIGFPYLGRIFFSDKNAGVISLIFGGLGGLAGFGIYTIVQKRNKNVKIAALTAEIIIVLTLVYSAAWFFSDQQLVKRNWKTHKIEMVSFQHPNKFKEIQLKNVDNKFSRMQVFSDGNKDRLAMYMIYDFKDDPPEIQKSIEGSIENVLNTLNATNINYFDWRFVIDTYETKFSYGIDGKPFTGFGFIFKQDKHFESIFIVPAKRKYSEEYIKKIRNSIRHNSFP